MKILEELHAIIIDRMKNPIEGSYVSSLISGGEEGILGKVEEESDEVVEAARTGSKDEIIHEAADLLFHLLVLMGYKGINLSDIEDELARRRK
jgi:phosphoribosyl-ATP pyrophosphohydrolase/phosphoribosyl-AMP cyclohydrolase